MLGLGAGAHGGVLRGPERLYWELLMASEDPSYSTMGRILLLVTEGRIYPLPSTLWGV